jgi:hypothetical protein
LKIQSYRTYGPRLLDLSIEYIHLKTKISQIQSNRLQKMYYNEVLSM